MATILELLELTDLCTDLTDGGSSVARSLGSHTSCQLLVVHKYKLEKPTRAGLSRLQEDEVSRSR